MQAIYLRVMFAIWYHDLDCSSVGVKSHFSVMHLHPVHCKDCISLSQHNATFFLKENGAFWPSNSEAWNLTSAGPQSCPLIGWNALLWSGLAQQFICDSQNFYGQKVVGCDRSSTLSSHVIDSTGWSPVDEQLCLFVCLLIEKKKNSQKSSSGPNVFLLSLAHQRFWYLP